MSAISGQQDERLLAGAQAFGDRFEIDFGLARSGDAVEQHRDRSPCRSPRPGWPPPRPGRRLSVGRREFGVGTGERPVGLDRHRLERAGIDQAAQHGVADLGMRGQLADRPLPAFERGQRLQPLRGHALGHVAGRPIFDQLPRPFERRGRRQHHAQHRGERARDNNRRPIRRGGAAGAAIGGTSSSAASGRSRLSPTSSVCSRSASQATPTSWRGPKGATTTVPGWTSQPRARDSRAGRAPRSGSRRGRGERATFA